EVNIMKTSKRNKLLGLVILGGFSLLSANNALAAAGDSISNRATLSFTVGGQAQTDIGSSPTGNTSGPGADTAFLEDRLINFVVSEQDGATVNVAPSSTLQVQRFQIENTGNDVQDFLLLARDRDTGTDDPHSANTDTVDVTATPQVFVDVNANGTYEVTTDTAVFVDELAAGATSPMIFIVSSIPDNTIVSDGDIAVMALVAQVAAGGAATTEGTAITNDNNNNISPAGVYSNTNTVVAEGTPNNDSDDPANVETVFNDPAGTVDSLGDPGAARIGQASADHSYTVQAAALTVTKSVVAIWDPVNFGVNPKAISGSYVRYTITIENGPGAGDADLTTMTDTLVAALTLDPDYINGTDAVDPPVASDSADDESFDIRHFDSGNNEDEQNYCTHDTADGCSLVGQLITIDISTVMTNATLAAGESLTISFNAIYP
ncbi:hypothetical protein N9112_03435, partial [bacterium]|nr:hypothetical protein [bacterium]